MLPEYVEQPSNDHGVGDICDHKLVQEKGVILLGQGHGRFEEGVDRTLLITRP